MTGAQWSSYQSQPQYRGGTTDYNNANGASAGRATTMGNTTCYLSIKPLLEFGPLPSHSGKAVLHDAA